jgi:hypothetical protein
MPTALYLLQAAVLAAAHADRAADACLSNEVSPIG